MPLLDALNHRQTQWRAKFVSVLARAKDSIFPVIPPQFMEQIKDVSLVERSIHTFATRSGTVVTDTQFLFVGLRG